MSPTALLLDQLAESLTDDAARRIVSVQLAPELQARIDELAARANNGELTPEERSDYAAAIDGIDLLGIFKAKARAGLARRTA